MGGLVELNRAEGIVAEQTVDDTDMEVEVSVQGRNGLPSPRPGKPLDSYLFFQLGRVGSNHQPPG